MLNETQAELTLCATLLWQPDLTDDLDLAYTEFVDPQYALVYRTIGHLHERNNAVTWTTVSTKLGNRIDSEHTTALADASLSQPWAVKEHATIIRQSATRRRMVRASHELLRIATESPDMGDEAMGEMEAAIAEVSAGVEQTTGPVLLQDLLTDYEASLTRRYNDRDSMRGVTTGFGPLDAVTGGWRPGELSIIAARPSMGKTAFMLQTAINASWANATPVVFSVEMASDGLLDRMVANQSWVSMYRINTGRLNDGDWPSIAEGFLRLDSRPFYVDDNPYCTVSYIRSRLRRLARKQADDTRLVVFVDYLQLVKLSRRGRSRNEEVGEISSELKAIAKEIGCPVVALAQLNRGVEQRAEKKPTLSDIRDSGQIEQDADVIMFLYRDAYYNPETEQRNVVEVIVGKNRNGPTGTVKVAFLGEYQAFREIQGGDHNG